MAISDTEMLDDFENETMKCLADGFRRIPADGYKGYSLPISVRLRNRGYPSTLRITCVSGIDPKTFQPYKGYYYWENYSDPNCSPIKLKTKFTLEAELDAKAYNGLDVEAELISLLTQEISMELKNMGKLPMTEEQILLDVKPESEQKIDHSEYLVEYFTFYNPITKLEQLKPEQVIYDVGPDTTINQVTDILSDIKEKNKTEKTVTVKFRNTRNDKFLRVNWNKEVFDELDSVYGLDVETEIIKTLCMSITQEMDSQLLNDLLKMATAPKYDIMKFKKDYNSSEILQLTSPVSTNKTNEL